MTAIALGALGLVVAVKLARFALFRVRGGRGGCHRDGGGIGRNRFLRWLFSRLDTTPGQERTIHEALAALRDTLRALRGREGEVRTHVASALRSDVFEPREISGAADTLLRAGQDAVVEAMRRIHEVLDPKQRETLAGILETRRRFGGPSLAHGGPYRT